MSRIRGSKYKTMEAVAMLESKVARDIWARDVCRQANVVLSKDESTILNEVVKEVAAATGVLTTEILGKSQAAKITRARQFAFYQCARLGMTRNVIGDAFGRDASTVTHGIQKIRKALGK